MSNRIDIALSKMVLRAPAYAALALNLKVKATTTDCPYMATDGVHLLYNPKGIADWTDIELITVIAHEVEHCGRQHIFRRNERDPLLWNIAIDFEVNESLASETGWVLPTGALRDPALRDKCAEDIYAELLKKAQKQPQSDKGQGKPGKGKGDSEQEQGSQMGQCLDAPGTPEEQKQLKQEWERNVVIAAKTHKSQGKLPGWMEAALDEFEHPKEDWRHVLSSFFTARAKNDYSWSRPNRRYVQSGFILPGLSSHSLGTVVLVADTSGSTCEWWGKFFDHVQAILNTCNPQKVVYMECDADVAFYQELMGGDVIQRKLHGGGGTSFKPPFARLEKEGITPDCLVYLTDLYGDFPSDPGYPVLWATTTDEKIPFGQRLQLRDA